MHTVQSEGSATKPTGLRARIARRFGRRRGARSTAERAPDVTLSHLSHEVPDSEEWEESLIGIEPNSGEIGPPTIC